jgi:small subunit ribosomal protein S4
MGDPRKLTNRYESPRRVWDADRIKREKHLATTYGLKNTREIWRALYVLKKARSGAMKYLSQGEAGAKGAEPLMRRLARLGVVGPEAKLDDILALSVENFLDRRLPSRVMKKGLARTAQQARQLITHGFIAVNGKRVTVPSYTVTVTEDATIAYYKPIDISVHEGDNEKKPARKTDAPEAPAEAEKPSAA